MTDEEYDAICEQADKLWLEAHDEKPNDSFWGMYSYGDAPGGIGGGVGSFVWFPSEDLLLDFIAAVLPFSPPGPASMDHALTAKKVKEIVEQVRSGDSDLNVSRAELNDVLKRYSQIEWFGTFEELRSGESDYSKKVLERFRYMEDEDEGPPRELSDQEVDEFIDFLREYGI